VEVSVWAWVVNAVRKQHSSRRSLRIGMGNICGKDRKGNWDGEKAWDGLFGGLGLYGNKF
jgi:hypothetical protein